MAAGPLVSVIIPAWNAQSTLGDALRSAGEQSYRNLEIIVVDDGAIDDTWKVAAEYAARDGRVRVVRQANAGLANARNRGIAESRGEWIAPLDADDLWHPEKIARQLSTATGWPRPVGLVYNWSRIIDPVGAAVHSAPGARFAGRILRQLLTCNFIGNGSTPLIRRSALGAYRYDPRVDACADYLLQLQLAVEHEFAVAPAFLTGYRLSPNAMSADALQMARSHLAMYQLFRSQFASAHPGLLRAQLARWRARHALLLLRRSKFAEALTEAAAAGRCSPVAALSEVYAVGQGKLGGSSRLPLSGANRPQFRELDADSL